MLGSTLLDVFIGLVLIYLILSLTCSAIVELIAGSLRLRAINFRAGICNLLAEHSPADSTADNDSDSLNAFKTHPLVLSMSGQAVGKWFKRDAGWPSYMHARTFGSVVLDLLAPKHLPVNQQRSFWALRASVVAPESLPTALPVTDANALGPWKPSKNLAQILRSFISVAETHVSDDLPDADLKRLALFRSQIEAWFDEGMDRAAGWYKQKSQKLLIVIALALTLLLNVDTVGITRQLYSDPTARAGLVALAQRAAATQPIGETQLDQSVISQWQAVDDAGIPIGWRRLPSWNRALPVEIVTKLVGLLLTTMAVSLGAPFWFDMLNKLANVRATGARPEKSDAAEALDQLTKADSDTADGKEFSEAEPSVAVAGAVAVTPPSAALILPANYWSLPVRKSDPLKFDPDGVGYAAGTAAMMARLSMLAYQDEPQLRRVLASAYGIEDSPGNEGALIQVFGRYDEFAFAAVIGNAVVVSFRGTVPAKLNTILADAGICLVPCPYGNEFGKVHCGFLGALNGLQNKIEQFVARHPGKRLFVTGHSLGAAMGTLYAAKRMTTEQGHVAGLYTFGSPRVGDQAFVRAVDHSLQGRSFRLINEEDLVTRVAPRELNYDHLNAPMFLNAAGQLEIDGVGWSRFLNTVVNALNDFRQEAQSSLYDHHIELYVRKLDNLA